MLRSCKLWNYNTRTLQGFTTDECGQYACLRAVHGPGLNPSQFIDLFGTTQPVLQVETAFLREFGQQHPRPSGGIRGGQCCT